MCAVQRGRTVEIGAISLIDMASRVCVCGSLSLAVEFSLFTLNAPQLRQKYSFCVRMNKLIMHFSKRGNVRKLLSSVLCMQHERGLKGRLLKVSERVSYEDRAILG